MKAMVLCAGYGTRLGDLTRETPKPMLPVGGRPLLGQIIANLARHGFRDLTVNLHFRPEQIEAHFGDGAALGVRLRYSFEPVLLGTAGGVRSVADWFRGGGPFLVHYGDVVTDQDLTAMLRFHRERGALATVLVHRRAGSNSVVGLDERGRVVGFLERPTDEERRSVDSPWVFSGVLIGEQELLDSIPPTGPRDFPRDVFPELVARGRLFGFPLSGRRFAIDSAERLVEANAAAAAGLLRIEPSVNQVPEGPSEPTE